MNVAAVEEAPKVKMPPPKPGDVFIPPAPLNQTPSNKYAEQIGKAKDDGTDDDWSSVITMNFTMEEEYCYMNDEQIATMKEAIDNVKQKAETNPPSGTTRRQSLKQYSERDLPPEQPDRWILNRPQHIW